MPSAAKGSPTRGLKRPLETVHSERVTSDTLFPLSRSLKLTGMSCFKLFSILAFMLSSLCIVSPPAEGRMRCRDTWPCGNLSGAANEACKNAGLGTGTGTCYTCSDGHSSWREAGCTGGAIPFGGGGTGGVSIVPRTQ
jgi:hypothetical protein